MVDSALVTKFIPAYTGNYTKNRAAQGGKISEITIHHCAGKMTVESLGALWQRKGRKGSSHYGVSGDKIGQYVAESDVAWTNSNWAANCRAVTIEVSNTVNASDNDPNWPVSDASIETLIKLVADIAKRRGLGKLVVGKNLTYHSMYAATACPGPCLKSKLTYICDKANRLNAGGAAASAGAASAAVPYTVRVTAKDVYIRKGPGTGYGMIGKVAPGVYTIVAESTGAGAALWGRLKSGAGWIALDGCKKI